MSANAPAVCWLPTHCSYDQMTRITLHGGNVRRTECGLPMFSNRAAVEHFGDARPRRQRRIFRQRIWREKAVRYDLAVRLRRRALVRRANDVQANVITPCGAPIELDLGEGRL